MHPPDALSFLTLEEKKIIPNEISEKIVDVLNDNLISAGTLRAEIEKLRTNSDQQKFQLERELISLRKLLEEEGQQKSQATHNLEAVEKRASELEINLKKSNERINQLLIQLELSRTDQETTTAQSAAIAGSLESREILISELKNQIIAIEQQLVAAQKAKYEAITKSEESHGLQVQFQYKERRYEQEKNLMSRQSEMLAKQLDSRIEECLTLRNEHISKILCLQSELNTSIEEARILKEERGAHQKTIEEKSAKIKTLLSSLNEATESEVKLEETFKQELSANERLCTIYKDTSEDQQRRCTELEAGVEELRQLLREASEQYGALERAKNKSQQDAEQQLNNCNLLIKDLKEEVEKVNKVLEANTKKDDALLEMSPAASAASHLMKKGLTLSQLYTEYMNTTDRLFGVEEDNKRLNRYVNQILQEIEDKAPLLNKQRDDYHRALETIETLHNQVDNSIDELEKQRQEAEDSQRRASFLGRENDKQSQQIKDLSKQVTILLTQVEAARAGIPAPPISVLEHMATPTCAGDVINDRLVAFRDVSELQQQNSKLLTSLREVTDKLETAEKVAVESKTQELQDELKEAAFQLDDMKTSREKLQSMIESLIKQRDLYKAMSSEDHPVSKIQGVSPTAASTPRPRGMLFEAAEVTELKKELKKLKHTYEEYRTERSINDEMERTERETLKSNYEKYRGENIKLISQAEYNEERIKTLNGNCEAFQRQVNALDEKCTTLSGIIGRHESTIDSLREQSMKLSKQLSSAEVLCFNLKEEKCLLKENEARLLAEQESLHQGNVSQSMILSNLEVIKNNLERTDYEAKIRQENQIMDLTKQCARLKSKLESNSDLQEAQLRLVSLEEQLKISKEDTVAAKKYLTESEATLAAARAQIADAARSQLTGFVNRNRPSPSSSPCLTSTRGVVGQSTRELEVQLSEEQAKINTLQASNTNIQQKNDQLKTLCNQQETQLAEATKANKEAEEVLSKLKTEVSQHEINVKTLNEKLTASESNEVACRDSLNRQIEEITKILEIKEGELAKTLDEIREFKQHEIDNLAKVKQQIRITSEAQDKYEREVMLHAADLKALSVLKEKLNTHNEQIDELTAAKESAESILAEKQTGLDAREIDIKKSNDVMKTRVSEMEEQNQCLLSQFTQLSDKMAAIQSKLSNQSEGSQISFSDDEARTTEQQSEVIKYLRREKEISIQKVEVAQAETQRLEAQKKSLESQIENLSKNLAEERLKNQSSMDNATRFGEIMRKVQTVDALADSNKLLRGEKDSLKSSLDETTAKSASLQEQIIPIQEKLRGLVAENDNLMADKKSLDAEKERFRKRIQELVEKLNKSKPEDLIKLQQELGAAQSSNQAKDSEINRLKNFSSHLQKTHQAVMANKNQIQSQLDSSRDEMKKTVEESKRIAQEKIRMQQQVIQLTEKNKNMESMKQMSNQAHQLEIQKAQEQIADVRQKEENRRMKELEVLKKECDNRIKELEDKNESLEKQTTQLRKIATKYKRMAAEAVPESSEAGEEDLNKSCSKDERMKQLEEKLLALQQQLEAVEKGEKSRAQPGPSAEAMSEGENSTVMKDLCQSDETNKKIGAYESRIMILEKEKDEQLHKVENLSKKLSMQQKQLENLQKQSVSASKASTSVLEKTSEAPPTANIKPMAAPVQPASVRNQSSSQIVAGQSRTIPTASIRPLTPSVLGQGVSTVGIVSPLETLLSGDGAVSSTVTLPQATVTPTPAVPTTVATSFPSTLTATVSPTPVSSSIAVGSAYPQQFSAIGTTQPQAPGSQASVSQPGPSQVQSAEDVIEHSQDDTNDASADSLVSQAVSPLNNDEENSSSDSYKEQPAPSGSHKRKQLDSSIEEDVSDHKRSKIQDDSGEPSSSSNVKKSDDCDELIVVPSDDEELIQTSERDEDMEDVSEEGNGLVIASVHAGSEAELRLEQDQMRDDESNDRVEVESSFPQPERSSRDQEQPSSSRQSFPHFSQITQFEEGMEDSIVPSTPTLIIQPPLDGQSNDGVSSLQVPSQDFVFSTGISQSSEVITMSHGGGLSQISEGEIIDVTRVDLGQLEDTQKITPVLPLEVTSEGSISSSAGEGSRGQQIAGPSGISGSFTEDTSNKQEEPDSGLDESEQSQREQELIELEDYDQSVRTPDDQASHNVEEQEEIIPAESASPQRSSRSAAAHSQPFNYAQSRRITPITWDNKTRPGRGGTRGRLMQNMSSRGQNPRFPGRGTVVRGQKARRARGNYSRG